MDKALDRVELLIGKQQTQQIMDSSIMVVGCGGVGAMAAEALVRFGVGKIILVDHDVVAMSNLNRQIHATVTSIGEKKVDALYKRLRSISDRCDVITIDRFIDQSNIDELFKIQIDVMIDAIDTVTSKLMLIKKAQEHDIPIVSSMGMGNRMDPTQIRVLPLNKTTHDPLAKVVRYQCRKQGLDDTIRVVCSLETPIKQTVRINDSPILKQAMPPSSSSFVPMAAGLACGYEAISIILSLKEVL